MPGYEYTGWNGLSAPAGTPPAIIDKLHAMFVSAGKDPNVTKKMEASGTILVNSAATCSGSWDAGCASG